MSSDAVYPERSRGAQDYKQKGFASPKFITEAGFAPILIVLLIALGIGGYFVYKQSFLSDRNNQPKTEPPQTTKAPQASPKVDLIEKCGDIPKEIGVKVNHYTVIDGPAWSPDCKHIAWSLWQSGTGVIDIDATPTPAPSVKPTPSPLPFEGIYLYDAQTKKTKKIISPKPFDENSTDNPGFGGWQDENTFSFSRVTNLGREGCYYNIMNNTISGCKKLN